MINEFPKTIEQADPSKFSLREEALKLKRKDGDDFYVDQETGEMFYRLYSDKAPKNQRLVAQILKGVVNVSDVVKVGRYYYSHVQQLRNVEAVKGDIHAEAEADSFILEYVAMDGDHSLNDGDHNIILDKDNKKLVFYDFSETSFGELIDSQESMQNVKYWMKRGMEKLKFDRLTLNILKRKAELLLGLYKENDFATFSTIVDRSGLKLTKYQKELLFVNILQRIKVLQELVSEELNDK